MLINFTLEPIKILTSRLLVRHGGLVTKIRVKQKKKTQQCIKPQRQLERQEYLKIEDLDILRLLEVRRVT